MPVHSHPARWRPGAIPRGLLLLLVGSWLFASGAGAQPIHGYHLFRNRKKVVVPFELHSNLIIVPIRINNSDTLNFILDTGVSVTLVTDPKVGRSLGLVPVRKVKIAGAGSQGELTASVTLGATVRMHDIRADNIPLLILSEDILALSDYIGIPIHGVFGYDLFNRFVVNIDFEAKLVTFTLPERHRYRRAREGTKLPITIENTKPYLTAMAIVEDGKSVPIKVIVDTGAGHALSLDLGSHQQIHLPDKVVRSQLGRGLSGVINGSLGRLGRVKIGDFTLDNVVTSYPDSTSLYPNPARDGNRQGNLGCEMLRRFRVTFNYQDGYLALRPIRKRLKESFEHDMSGLELRARGANYRNYMIERVQSDSPAAAAGLMAGDEIMFFNGEPVREMPMNDIYKLLQKKEGKEIKLMVKRDNELIYTTFILRRII
ncbi:MAG: aspartyl protease family protein [Ferruginibacter sp.]|nr:aspartyl protease family protein [Cytophagales bacterium]